MIIYDYSRPSLAFRRKMIEEWDGREFSKFAHTATEQLSQQFQSKIRVIPDEIFNDEAAMAREFQREVIDHFGSEQEWLAHWEAYRRLPHQFECVDLIGNPFDTRKMFATHAQGDCLIWLSDMFVRPTPSASIPATTA